MTIVQVDSRDEELWDSASDNEDVTRFPDNLICKHFILNLRKPKKTIYGTLFTENKNLYKLSSLRFYMNSLA